MGSMGRKLLRISGFFNESVEELLRLTDPLADAKVERSSRRLMA